jgi:hypothetical protein
MKNDVHPLLQQRPTLNPYRSAAALAWGRLKWDLSPLSWQSRAALKRCKDRHPGQAAVVLCNGPSLLHVDFDKLGASSLYCFGLNKINLLFDKTGFRPGCVVCVNPFVIEQNADFFNQTEIPLFLDSGATAHIRARSHIAFLHSASLPKFARDCSISVFQGYTVTFVALQLAFHMGFRRVALVGADHNFASKGPANQVVVSGASDASHFDPSYFAGGVKWQLPDLFQSEIAYTMARDMFDAFGGQVVNCTVGGQLEVFQRQSLDDFLSTEAAR